MNKYIISYCTDLESRSLKVITCPRLGGKFESLLQKLKLPWTRMFLMAVTFCDASFVASVLLMILQKIKKSVVLHVVSLWHDVAAAWKE